MDESTKYFMNEYNLANRIHVHNRTFIFPEYTYIIVGDMNDFKKLSLKELFKILKIPQKRLKEVFEYDQKEFTGRFTENGKQTLADILIKEIAYWERPHSEPITIGEPQVYYPIKV